MSKKLLCKALLLDGRQCRNPAKSGLNGYCGIHKSRSSKTMTISEKADLTAKVAGAAVALTVLIEKACKYLPNAVEVIRQASELAFIFQTEEELQEVKKTGEVLFRELARSNVEEILSECVQEQNWQRLYLYIGGSTFSLYRSHGNLPRKLSHEIDEARNELGVYLAATEISSLQG